MAEYQMEQARRMEGGTTDVETMRRVVARLDTDLRCYGEDAGLALLCAEVVGVAYYGGNLTDACNRLRDERLAAVSDFTEAIA